VNQLDILALVKNRIFEPMRDGETHINRITIIGTSQQCDDQIKKGRCEGHMTRMGAKINTYRILVGNP